MLGSSGLVSCKNSSAKGQFLFVAPFLAGSKVNNATDFARMLCFLLLLSLVFWAVGWGRSNAWVERLFLVVWPLTWVGSHYFIWGENREMGWLGPVSMSLGVLFFVLASKYRFRLKVLSQKEFGLQMTGLGLVMAFTAISLANSKHAFHVLLIGTALVLALFFRARGRV